jgi:hypothetical protein
VAVVVDHVVQVLRRVQQRVPRTRAGVDGAQRAAEVVHARVAAVELLVEDAGAEHRERRADRDRPRRAARAPARRRSPEQEQDERHGADEVAHLEHERLQLAEREQRRRGDGRGGREQHGRAAAAAPEQRERQQHEQRPERGEPLHRRVRVVAEHGPQRVRERGVGAGGLTHGGHAAAGLRRHLLEALPRRLVGGELVLAEDEHGRDRQRQQRGVRKPLALLDREEGDELHADQEDAEVLRVDERRRRRGVREPGARAAVAAQDAHLQPRGE